MAHDADAPRTRVRALVDELRGDLVGLSEYLHANPEIAFEERKSSAAIRSLMERRGFAVERGVGGLETAFKAVGGGGKGGPAVAFIAEYDALPDLGHACGHNLIAAMSAGAAIAADRALGESGMAGTVVLVGAPAEERGGGKVTLVAEGAFEGIDCAVMIHPSSGTRVEDFSLASTRLVLTYRGKPAHAAAAPWNGANALEAVIQTFNQVNAWRCQLRDLARINGIITKGGTAVNIIPELAEASFGIRATNRKYLEELVELVGACARHAAAAMGVEVEVVRMGRGYDSIMNNPVLCDLMASSFRELGEDVLPRAPDMGVGSTDMGNVTHAIPSAHCYVKVAPGIEAHTPAFAEACRGESGARALMIGAKAMGMAAMELFSEPSRLAAAREAFLAQERAQGSR